MTDRMEFHKYHIPSSRCDFYIPYIHSPTGCKPFNGATEKVLLLVDTGFGVCDLVE